MESYREGNQVYIHARAIQREIRTGRNDMSLIKDSSPQTAEVKPNAMRSEAKPGAVKMVLFGRNGLRAFWRFLAFIIILLALQKAIFAILHRTGGISEFTARAVLLSDGLQLLIVLAAALIMGYFEKRSLTTYGLPLRIAFSVRLVEGVCWGFLALNAVMLVLYLTRTAVFHGLDQRRVSAFYFALAWGAAFLVVGLFEEFLFRGYTQFTLATGIGFWPSAILLSTLFGFGHMGNVGETWMGGVAAGMLAFALCASLWLTGNLWFAIGFHAGWDWTQTFFWGVPDSGHLANGHFLNSSLHGSRWMTGGTVGPEGSVIAPVVALLVMGLLFLRFNKGKPDGKSASKVFERV